MKTLLIVTLVSIAIFVFYSEIYIRIHSKLRLSSRCILVFFGGILMASEIIHFIMSAMLILKVFSKDYELIYPPTHILTVDKYDRKTGEIYYTYNDQEYIGDITSDEVVVEYGDKDYSTATFYNAEYRVWIYSIDTTVCKVELSKLEIIGE